MKAALLVSLAAALSFRSAAALAQQQQDPFPLPPKDWPKPVTDSEPFAYALVDRLEYRSQAGRDLRVWDAQGWIGGDRDKFWFKTEGENEAGGRTERAEAQALYARRIAPFWHVQAGVRRDARSGIWRNTGVLALQGLAPYWFDVEAMSFIGDRGVSGRLEVETDVLLGQRLILQPRVETQFSGYAEPERGVGRGIEHVEAGLRLRYEIRRELAPYIGVSWTRKVGDTADLARSRGEDVRSAAIVVGLRLWY